MRPRATAAARVTRALGLVVICLFLASLLARSSRAWLGYRTVFESWLSLSTGQSLARWFAAGVWLAAAGSGLLVARQVGGGPHKRRSVARWGALAVLCVGLSIEESTQLFARLVEPMHDFWPAFRYAPWMTFAAAFLILAAFRTLLMIEVTRSSARRLLAAGALYLMGRVSTSLLLASYSGWLGPRVEIFVLLETAGRLLMLLAPVLVLRALLDEQALRGGVFPQVTQAGS